MQPQVAVVQQPAGFIIPKTGWLRLVFESAHLEVNRGSMMNKQDPFVWVRVGKGQEWRSNTCVNGGKNPQWHNQHMDIPVKKLGKLDKNVHIEIRDQNLLNSEPLGHANVTLGLFASRGPVHERVSLMFQGRHAGHLMMRSVFHEDQATVVLRAPAQPTVVVQPQAPVVVQQPQVVVQPQPVQPQVVAQPQPVPVQPPPQQQQFGPSNEALERQVKELERKNAELTARVDALERQMNE
jgi:hypothetical protein